MFKKKKDVKEEEIKNAAVDENTVDDENVEIQDVDYKSQFLRVNADFQNFKKRMEKERIEWFVVSQASVLKQVLPVVDDFDRAIKTDQKGDITKEEKVWLEGFEIIKKKFMKILTDLGVEEVLCDGSFDPELHEALMTVESEDHKEGEIVQVLSKGYRFKDQVLIHAKVSVAK